MRILFTAVPAHGHILPLAPLMAAAIHCGHSVGLLTGENVKELAEQELAPEVEFLAAGASTPEFLAEAARRTGGDPLRPSPTMIGEIFGGARLHLDAEKATHHAREWAPHLIVAEAFDTVGPFLAAQLGVPWHQAGIGPGAPAMMTEQITAAVAPHYARAGVEPVAAATYLDPCPPVLQDPAWVSPAPVLQVRARAHRRPSGATVELPRFTDADKPTVLLTLGTVFSEAPALAAFASAVADAGVNVLATLGLALEEPRGIRGELRYVPFAPLDQLLSTVDLVVAAGGAGTVLGAMSRGVPMVLCPQGADQPINAARAEAAGVAVVVDSPAGLTDAVSAALSDDTLRARAAEVAADIAKAPEPADVITALVSR
ncbi:glycosyltransferase [Amycolatopsis lurida]